MSQTKGVAHFCRPSAAAPRCTIPPTFSLAAGYPIGSGVAEGACRHLVKDRMEQTGMRWTVEGAQAMLHVRALYLNDQWEEFHEHRVEREQARLYTRPAA